MNFFKNGFTRYNLFCNKYPSGTSYFFGFVTGASIGTIYITQKLDRSIGKRMILLDENLKLIEANQELIGSAQEAQKWKREAEIRWAIIEDMKKSR